MLHPRSDCPQSRPVEFTHASYMSRALDAFRAVTRSLELLIHEHAGQPEPSHASDEPDPELAEAGNDDG